MISLTLANDLSYNHFSYFCLWLAANEPRFVDRQNHPPEKGYLKLLLRQGFRSRGFINPLPRKGTETLLLPLISQIFIWFINPLPRKGTETFCRHMTPLFNRVFINPLPRKGTETVIQRSVMLPAFFVH